MVKGRHTPTRRVRITDESWDLLLRGAAITNTTTSVVLIGAITEALLRLLDLGIPIAGYLETLDGVTAQSMTRSTATPVMIKVRRRLAQYGYAATPNPNS